MFIAAVYASYVNRSEESKVVNLIIAAYAPDGKLVHIETGGLGEIKPGAAQTATMNVAELEGCTIKAFAWDADFIPVSGSVICQNGRS